MEKKTYQTCHPWRLKDSREYHACVRHMGRKDSLFTLAPDTREFARLLPRIKSEWPVHLWLGRFCNQFGRWNHASFGCKTSVTVGDSDLQVRVWGTFPNPWKKLFWALYNFTSFANLQGNNTVIYCFASRGKGWFFFHGGGERMPNRGMRSTCLSVWRMTDMHLCRSLKHRKSLNALYH